MKVRTHWYVYIPMSFYFATLSRNYAIRNAMDRIYYSVESVYDRLRSQHERERDLSKI